MCPILIHQVAWRCAWAAIPALRRTPRGHELDSWRRGGGPCRHGRQNAGQGATRRPGDTFHQNWLCSVGDASGGRHVRTPATVRIRDTGGCCGGRRKVSWLCCRSASLVGIADADSRDQPAYQKQRRGDECEPTEAVVGGLGLAGIDGAVRADPSQARDAALPRGSVAVNFVAHALAFIQTTIVKKFWRVSKIVEQELDVGGCPGPTSIRRFSPPLSICPSERRLCW